MREVRSKLRDVLPAFTDEVESLLRFYGYADVADQLADLGVARWTLESGQANCGGLPWGKDCSQGQQDERENDVSDYVDDTIGNR